MPEIDEQTFEIPELRTSFVFRRRPLAIPGDLRPSWRIGLLLLLLLRCCRASRSSLARLHVLSWGVRTRQSQLDLRAAIAGNVSPYSIIVRFDPFLDRAIDFAIGEKLIVHDGGKAVRLTELGKQRASELEDSASLFQTEKQFIASIRQGVSEALVNQMFR